MNQRLRIVARGISQGVGMRPFVHRVAESEQLGGFVRNAPDALEIEVEGQASSLERFLRRFREDAPRAADLCALEVEEVSPRGERDFAIVGSRTEGRAGPAVSPDLAICALCDAEIRSGSGRRAGYPFTSCTRCGPRFTIVRSLPYDRSRTSMVEFPPCSACRGDYESEESRWFHAETVSCADCGPTLAYSEPYLGVLAEGASALARALALLNRGEILALKGLGGFHLVADATDDSAIERLRARKRRSAKPFAVMFPDIESVRRVCAVSEDEARVLESGAAPIVLLEKRGALDLASSIAPGLGELGAFLPYTPLHALLSSGIRRPLVCTSGNVAEEPICTRIEDARERLAPMASAYLDHDRDIVRPVDDSVVRVLSGAVQVLRRARGYVPKPISFPAGPSVLALGAHQKSTVTLAHAGAAVMSAHLGDLSSAACLEIFERTVEELERLFGGAAEVIACDLHPDYASTRVAERIAAQRGLPLERVQHHHAHIRAVCAELGLDEEVLGLAWDGSGLGTDGTLWGGEALAVRVTGFSRVAHLRSFGLPGGERAARDGRRALLGLMVEAYGAEGPRRVAHLYKPEELHLWAKSLEKGVSTIRTSSIGRLFDAIAALAGACSSSAFEGQAAMLLEAAAHGEPLDLEGPRYTLPLSSGSPGMADFAPLLEGVLEDLSRKSGPRQISARFHRTLAHHAVEVARRAGLARVVVSGGCFQNRRLSVLVERALVESGFVVHRSKEVPPNDGGISLGQAHVALHRRRRAPCV